MCVCNEICENLAKLKRLKNNKGYLDCLKFFQSNLSSGKGYLMGAGANYPNIGLEG